MLRICHVIASINRDAGGPSITVPNLVRSLATKGVICSLVALNYENLGPQSECPNVEALTLKADWLARSLRGWSPSLRKLLFKQVASTDIVHNHGLWMFPNLYARQAAARVNLPLVISPRGMLEEWSLGRGRPKKLLAWRLFEARNLATAALLHATSEAEAVSFRKKGLCQPVAIIPNGVEIPDLRTSPARVVLEEKYPELKGCRWLLFLSRIHPKKGVSELLTAWREVEAKFPDWHLILAGSDLDGHARVARNQANLYGIGHRVSFTGMLSGTHKECALANADVFVLPTHSENFGVAIAEALAYGLPVITTKNAPWNELTTRRCGWWIDLQISELKKCIEAALKTPKQELQEMGTRGRKLMIEKFAWDRVGAEMKQCYEWLLNRGEKPSCVQMQF
jgi:glycosyltransferase involved in cell wall biosynthesis